jgi:RNA polymerase sigma-70 factor, ECF subfamily
VQETDPALIRAATGGDLAAFERIVRTHQHEVWRYLRRLLGDDAAEDVAQETFLRVYRRLPTFTFQAKFSTWVFQIARNAGLDELRSRRRRDRLAAAVPPGPPTSTGPGEARVEIDAALASLPLDQREALVLVEVLGLRYREVATVLGVPEGTVKSRVFSARRHLARWARADEPDPRPAAEPGAAEPGAEEATREV